jgi:23S rRNA-/tRNA-specific pseudouridylate synthase
MHVVLLVTPIAVRRQRNFGNVLDNVAGVAIDAAVGSRQRKTRLRVVIKAPSRPPIRVMAERTICPHAPLMVLVPVAGRTHQRRILKPH